jgi:ABC-type ATPase with predicted acetyltransferase domain
MATYSVNKTHGWSGRLTDKSRLVMRLFGLTLGKLEKRQSEHRCTIDIQPGDIVYITGSSGAGKTTLLRELEQQIPVSQRVNVDEIDLPADKLVVDCVDGDFLRTLRILSAAGLSDAFSVLSSPVNLSDGQKWRFRLAVALASGKKFIFADEFCSSLDRICASVIAYRVQKFAKDNGVTFILASSHQDTLMDMAPDVLVTKDRCGPAQVTYKNILRQRKGCRLIQGHKPVLR